jgi:hypothetical protein
MEKYRINALNLGVKKKRDKNRFVLESKNNLFLGQSLNIKITYFLGGRQ